MTARHHILRTRRPLLAGFTLVEVILSLVVLSIIMATMTSAMQLMLRTASTSQNDVPSQASLSRTAADQIVDDLKLALTIPEQLATAVTVTVPDRDGNSTPETIRYAWSGVSGASLTRQYNGSAAVSIADNVTAFNVQHFLKTVGPTPPPSPVESGEQLLVASDTAASIASLGMTSTTWASQYFKPSLPVNAISWKITRIKVQVQRNGSAGGNIDLDVTAADSANKPTGSALQTISVGLGTIPAGAVVWVESSWSQLSALDPSIGLCLLAKSNSAAVKYYTKYSTAAPSYPGAWSTTADGGGSWAAPSATSGMQFYVYGTITTLP